MQTHAPTSDTTALQANSADAIDESHCEPIVVVGAAAAAAALCKSLRARGSRRRLILIDAEVRVPYDRPPLSKGVLTGAVTWDDLRLLPESVYDDQVELRLGVRAVGADLERRVVFLEDGSTVAFGDLVIATGVRARTFPDACALSGAHTLRTYDDALALAEDLRGATSIVVVGAGFIGLEVAASARRLGVDVTVIEAADRPMAGRVPEQVSSHFRLLHEAHGVEFRFGRTVREFVQDAGKFIGVVLDDESEIRAQVALVSVGSVPNTEWLQGSGLDLSNGVVCDEHNRAAPGVFAIGDVASVLHPHVQRHLRIEHRLTANVHAEKVSALLCGADPDPVSTPYFWSDQYDTKLQVHGLWSGDCDFEVLEADDAGGWMVGRATRGHETTAVVGVNAGGRLVRLRRQHLQRAEARL